MTSFEDQIKSHLDDGLFAVLKGHAEQARRRRLDVLLREVSKHIGATEKARTENSLVDLKTAKEVALLIEELASGKLTEEQEDWLKAVILYYIDWDDEENDFSSAIGFDDDLQIARAFERALKESASL